MKKTVYIFLSLATAFGCARVAEDAFVQEDTAEEASVVFVGGFGGTKTTIGEAVDGVYELTWSENDAIGIYSYDRTYTSNDNVYAILASSSAGEVDGVFTPMESVNSSGAIVSMEYPTDGSEIFLVYYPYNSESYFSDGVVYSEVPSLQTQEAVSDKQVGKDGFAYGLASVEAGVEEVDFALTHAMSYIRFVASSSEYSGYQLHSVYLYDEDGEAALTGEFGLNPLTGEVTPVDGATYPYARVTVEEDDFSASTDSQELYLTIFPGDYSSYDLKVAITFVASDGASVTIPLSFEESLNLASANLKLADLGDVSKSDNVYPWYEPEEPRDLLDRYAYGAQNTYFILQDQDTTTVLYNELTFEVKARGDLTKVTEPKYYSLLIPGTIERELLLLPSGVDSVEAIPSTPVNDDYTITVLAKPLPAKANWGVVAIYDEDYELIWSFMLMRYFSNDVPSNIEYTDLGISVMDRCLGMGYSFEYALAYMEDGSLTPSPCYFQWGRKDPFPYSIKKDNNGNNYDYERTQSYCMDIDYLIKHPLNAPRGVTYYDLEGNKCTTNGNWHVEGDIKDLWGCVNEGSSDLNTNLTATKKTIFDPCPEGYRVPDAKLIAYVKENSDSLYGLFGIYNVRRVKANATQDDYYPYWGGLKNGSASSDWGPRVAPQSGVMYWSNTNDVTSGSEYSACYVHAMYSSSSGWVDYTSRARASAYSIRCQVDEYGR